MPKKMNLNELKMIDDDEVSTMVGNSIVVPSQVTYASCLRSFKTMIEKLRSLPSGASFPLLEVTKREFLSCCKHIKDNRMQTAGIILSALKKEAAKAGQRVPWYNDADVSASVKACKLAGIKGKKPCGVLTFEQFSQLVDFLESEGEWELRYAVIVAMNARLRIGELMGLTLADFIPAENIGFVYLREAKQCDEDITPHPKLVPIELGIVLAKIATKKYGGATSQKLFGYGIDDRLRHHMDDWAILLNWSSALRWSGPHVFRHTGTSILKETLATRIGDAVLTIFAQQGEKTMKKYAESAVVRERKRARNA